MSLIPIRDSDFSFVPQSWHVHDITSFTLSFPTHDSYVFMSVWTNAINFFYIFLTRWGRLMRHICAITNIDRSAFFNKRNRNLSPSPAKPYQRKAAILPMWVHWSQVVLANHTQNSGFAGAFSFQKTTENLKGFPKLGKKWQVTKLLLFFFFFLYFINFY